MPVARTLCAQASPRAEWAGGGIWGGIGTHAGQALLHGGVDIGSGKHVQIRISCTSFHQDGVDEYGRMLEPSCHHDLLVWIP